MRATTAPQVWEQLQSARQSFMKRCERYAGLTVPKLLLPEGQKLDSTDITHDYQSIGASAVNHLTEKMMLALFRPGSPFFRLSLQGKSEEELAAAGIAKDELEESMSESERKAAQILDKRAMRPKLKQALRNCIALGNALVELSETDDSIRVYGLRQWACKRIANGKLQRLVIADKVRWDELEVSTRAALPQHATKPEESEVVHYRWIERGPTGDYSMTQWIDGDKLPDTFNGKWPANKLPYHVLVWDLADEADYGTGHVEEYSRDLEALSILSEAAIDGAVLSADWRWSVRPGGLTDIEEFRKSRSGDAYAGSPDDVMVVGPTGMAQSLQAIEALIQKWEQRISRGFLLQSGMIRQAERVTAEEIRQLAQELETAFGGVYSAFGLSLQKPVAEWLLKLAGGVDVRNLKDVEVSIITGLDALSRNADLDNLNLALMYLSKLSALPPDLLQRLKTDDITQFVGASIGLDLKRFLKSEKEFQAALAQAQQSQQAMAMAQASGDSAGQAIGQQAAGVPPQ